MHTGDTINRIEQVCPNGDHACNLRGYCVNKNCGNFQHRGETVAQLAEAVKRAEKNSKPYPGGMIGGVPKFNAENIAHVVAENSKQCEEAHYPGRAFPQVEDESDLQSMLDGLAADHERGN